MQVQSLAVLPRIKPVLFGEKSEKIEAEALDSLLPPVNLNDPVIDQLSLSRSEAPDPEALPRKRKPKKAGLFKSLVLGMTAALASLGLMPGKASAHDNRPPAAAHRGHHYQNPSQPYFVGPGPYGGNPYAYPNFQHRLAHQQLRALELQYQLQKQYQNPFFRNPVVDYYRDLQFYRQLNQMHNLYHLQNPWAPRHR